MRTYKFNQVCKTRGEREIYDLFETALSIVSRLKVDPLYPVDMELKFAKSVRKFGFCCVDHLKETSTIHLTDTLLLLDDDSILNTLIHELLHTLPNCQDHGSQWKAYSKEIYKMTGIEISRLSELPIPASQLNYKYLIKCSQCGKEYGFGRTTKVLNNLSGYNCHCGGKLERIR